MSRSLGGAKKLARRKSALALLEARYEKFKAAKEDKAPWTTHGGTKSHPGRSYGAECDRLAKEIQILKDKVNRAVV